MSTAPAMYTRLPVPIVLQIDIPGAPTGAARPRFVRGSGRTYLPDNHVKAEASAMWLIRTEWAGRAPLDQPVGVSLEVVVARPGRLMRKKDPTGRMACTSKPDVDNVAKLILDAVVKAGVLVDDTRVVDLHVRKLYAAIGEMPHVHLSLFTV